MSPSSIYLVNSFNTSCSSLHISLSPTIWVLLLHLLCIYFLLLPATIKIFLLSPRSRSRTYTKSQFISAFSRSPLGRANTINHFIPIPSLYPPYISKFFSDFTLVLSAMILILPCMPQTSLWTSSLIGFPYYMSFHTSSTTISHLIPTSAFVTFSHTTPLIGGGGVHNLVTILREKKK